jgi:hypothetical protein
LEAFVGYELFFSPFVVGNHISIGISIGVGFKILVRRRINSLQRTPDAGHLLPNRKPELSEPKRLIPIAIRERSVDQLTQVDQQTLADRDVAFKNGADLFLELWIDLRRVSVIPHLFGRLQTQRGRLSNHERRKLAFRSVNNPEGSHYHRRLRPIETDAPGNTLEARFAAVSFRSFSTACHRLQVSAQRLNSIVS